jgi:hypothetical protein
MIRIYKITILKTNPKSNVHPSTFHFADEPSTLIPKATNGAKLKITGTIYLKSLLQAYGYLIRRNIKADKKAAP